MPEHASDSTELSAAIRRCASVASSSAGLRRSRQRPGWSASAGSGTSTFGIVEHELRGARRLADRDLMFVQLRIEHLVAAQRRRCGSAWSRAGRAGRTGHDRAGDRDVHGQHAVGAAAAARHVGDRGLVDELGGSSSAALGVGVEEGGAFAQRDRRAIGAQLALPEPCLPAASACRSPPSRERRRCRPIGSPRRQA